MKPHYESSLRTNSTVDQAQDSVTRLHNAVSQAMSHPNEQMLAQAENSLEHAEEAVRHAPEGSVDGHGVELAEDRLADEQERLAGLKQQLGQFEN
ncbi:hypothetical protein R70723_31720 [Paenibacillus sp. FSL R7-0273]|uniref:hypothetical protein n=1 Tax=Paenibacillus sp. FSL R7-0273 TaxID=1536772 RepID=UPI0004F7769B|nr:hypothetical protein [Paenibacillus sp. FSL R7-0273]AIQ49940.1 hypothetical protein R70723_31720 [Paenibacillus sp. FSL R7-0273]OMF84517.1 hypothetical protein BK144_29770 [Paenibacillus sp. FSL R7-0273]